MGLDLWFPEDVARMLASVHQTMTGTQAAGPALDPARGDAYRQGFEDAIRAVAIAFGVCPPQLDPYTCDNGRQRLPPAAR